MLQLFVSHISEEKDVAIFLQKMMETDFPNSVEFFTSSDVGTIELGSNWLDAIKAAMQRADAVIVLCSKTSVRRPWVQFEVGAAWMKGLPIIPVCHSGMRFDDLETPLKDYEGFELATEEGLEALYDMVARRLKIDETPVPSPVSLQRLREIIDMPSDAVVQFEHYFDITVPAPGRLDTPTLPGGLVVDMNDETRKLFGMLPKNRWSWKDIVEKVKASPDKRWIKELQHCIHSASNDLDFAPIQAVFHTGGSKGSFQPQLAKFEVFNRGARRFHVHLVPTVVAPLFEVQNELGLLATLLRLGLRFRYEVIENHWKMTEAFEPDSAKLDSLRCAVEVIETDARSRGSQNFKPGRIVALFKPGADQAEMKQIQQDWDAARMALFSDPPPSCDEVDAAIRSMADLNSRFMHLGTKRFHALIATLWKQADEAHLQAEAFHAEH